MTKSDATAIPQPRWNSYAARHWRGELSLGNAYWLNGHVIFGIGINAFAVVAGMVVLVTLNQVPALAISLVLPVLVFQIAGFVWAVVGIWRAATLYAGNKAWAVISKIQIVLGIIISLFIVIAELGQLYGLITGA